MTSARNAVTTPTPSERTIAAVHVGEPTKLSYQRHVKNLGGHSMNASVVNDTGTMK